MVLNLERDWSPYREMIHQTLGLRQSVEQKKDIKQRDLILEFDKDPAFIIITSNEIL
jgi:hypothetical protein